jgi:HK97 family phage major capsid protein
MNIRERLAQNETYKAEMTTMVTALVEGKSFDKDAQAKYDELKAKVIANNDVVARAAELASFGSPKLPVTTDANTNPEDVRSSKEYTAAYKQFVATRGRTISDVLMVNVATGDFNSADGVLLPTTFEKKVVELAVNDSTMRQLAEIITTTQDVPFPVEDSRGDAAATQEAPGGAGSPPGTANYHQDDPTFSIKKLQAFKITKTVPVSEELFADYNSFQTYVASNLGRSIAEKEEAWFILGTGVDEPEGVVTAATLGTSLSSASAIDFVVDLNNLIGSLKSTYLKGAAFVMNRSVKTYLRTLTNDLGIPFWPSNDETLLGYPVYLSEEMPAKGASAKCILFGNFKQAVIIGDRSGLQTRILSEVSAKQGLVDFIGKRRTDQRVILPEAIKYLQMHS